MVKKLTQRKTAEVVAKLILSSMGRVKDIPPEILKSLVEDYKERERRHLSRLGDKEWHDLYCVDESAGLRPKGGPELGLTGGFVNEVYDQEYWRHPDAWLDRQMDVARYVFALELAELSESEPGAFVFDRAFAKAQGSNRVGEARQPDIDCEEVRKKAKNKGYFDLPKNSREKSKIIELIISDLGLYRNNKATSKASQHRHLKRILKT